MDSAWNSWIHKTWVWISVLPVCWLCNILGQDMNSMHASPHSGVNEYWQCHGTMGQTGQAPPSMGMLAASWNLHTKVGWSGPARDVIAKHSADKYLPVLLAALYKCAIFNLFSLLDKEFDQYSLFWNMSGRRGLGICSMTYRLWPLKPDPKNLWKYVRPKQYLPYPTFSQGKEKKKHYWWFVWVKQPSELSGI